jgi:hypothetical protein
LNKKAQSGGFLFDTNRDNAVVPFRDSLMAMNIKTQAAYIQPGKNDNALVETITMGSPMQHQ